MPQYNLTLDDFVRESWRLSNQPELWLAKVEELIEAHKTLLSLPHPLTTKDLEVFVKVAEPDAKLRRDDKYAVGELNVLLRTAGYLMKHGRSADGAVEYHQRFMHLMPFTSCNARVARALWLWMLETEEPTRSFCEDYYIRSMRGIKSWPE